MNEAAAVSAPEDEAPDSAVQESQTVAVTGSTTLVEAADGVAFVLGDVLEGMELVDLDLIPSFDQTQLATVLGTLGNASTIVGNVADATSKVRGLYRVNDATFSLLKSGGELAAKDGAKLGSILKNGKIVGQARFVPVSTTAATALVAIGPAVAMLALQMQLGEISELVRANKALTRQILDRARRKSWSELEGDAETLEGIFQNFRKNGVISETEWSSISSYKGRTKRHMKEYLSNVSDHVQKLNASKGAERRGYLEAHAEAIVFESYALMQVLKMYAEYNAIQAGVARAKSVNDESEKRLFNRIIQELPGELESFLNEAKTLIKALVRELNMIAEFQGSSTIPLSKKDKDNKISQRTCEELLKAIEPLAQLLLPTLEIPEMPDVVCAPDGLNLDPYLYALRLFMEEGEDLRCIAFLYESRKNAVKAVPAVLGRRVDAAWDVLMADNATTKPLIEKLAPSTFMVITDRRVITTKAPGFLKSGEIGAEFPLNAVKNVRARDEGRAQERPSIEVHTDHDSFEWMFPEKTDPTSIDALTRIIKQGTDVDKKVFASEKQTPAELPA